MKRGVPTETLKPGLHSSDHVQMVAVVVVVIGRKHRVVVQVLLVHGGHGRADVDVGTVVLCEGRRCGRSVRHLDLNKNLKEFGLNIISVLTL